MTVTFRFKPQTIPIMHCEFHTARISNRVYCPNEIEDEHHVLFKCPIYDAVRNKFRNFFDTHDSVRNVLTPRDVKDADTLGCLLRDIERVRKYNGMEFLNGILF